MTRSLTKLLKQLEKKGFTSAPDWIWHNPYRLWVRAQELAKLYQELKLKYEPPRCEHDGVEGDCALCLEEGKYEK